MITITYPHALVDHALRTVWCSPYQDRPSIIQGSRVSPKNGFNDYGVLFKVDFALPTRQHDYHVYMFGQNFPLQFNLPEIKDKWISLSEWVSQEDILVKLYTDIGRQFPLFESFVARDFSNNILIAVRINDRIADLNEVPLYMYFQKQYANSKVDAKLRIFDNYGMRVPLKKNIAQFQQRYLDLRNERRLDFTPMLINGIYRWDMKPNDIEEHDVIEYYDDQNIIGVYHGSIAGLKYFTSSMDKKQKYIFHIHKGQKDNFDIWYRDDIEITILKRDSQDRDITTAGAFLHKNREDTLRMITHQTYSIPVEYVQTVVKSFEAEPNYRDWYIQLTVRKSGLNRTLGNDVNHIRELFLLTDQQILNTMVNNTNTIPEWKADHLESSFYTYLMRAYRSEFTVDKVIKAYGYVGMAKALANPTALPHEDTNGKYFNVPIGLMAGCTAFNYNQSGKLIGYEYITNKAVYFPLTEEVQFVEFILGEGSRRPEVILRMLAGTHQLVNNYRHYTGITNIKTGEIDKWVDVTDDPSHYRLETSTGRYEHQIDKQSDLTVYISDGSFLCYDIELNSSDGVIDFIVTFDDALTTLIPYPVNPGKIDLWMNGNSLVEGIDYHVNFPHIAIVSQKYLIADSKNQKVTVRLTGFCHPDMTRDKPHDVGYVNNGYISTNSQYDLHEETLSRITVGGGCFHRAAFKFDKATGEAFVRPVKDGAPYSIDEYAIGLRGFLGHNPYGLLEKDTAFRKRITEYLSQLIPYPKRTTIPSIESRYPLYSPLISALITDFRNGTFQIVEEDYRDNLRLEKALLPYKRFLYLDPAYHGYDEHYAVLRPYIRSREDNHYDITFLQYQFLEAVIKRYLNGKVDLTTYIRIKG